MYTVVRRGFTEKGPFVQRLTGSEEEKPCSWRGNVLGRGESQCKGPDALAYLVYLKNKEAGVAGAK